MGYTYPVTHIHLIPILGFQSVLKNITALSQGACSEEQTHIQGLLKLLCLRTSYIRLYKVTQRLYQAGVV